MKTKINLITRFVTTAIALVMMTSVLSAKGDVSDVYTSGSSNSDAGDFVVRTTDQVYHFQGKEYEVYKVSYEDSTKDVCIAVNEEGGCKSYIAYCCDFTVFYSCNKNGFGVRKVMFNSPQAQEKFNSDEFKQQSVLVKKRRIEKEKAIQLIAAFLPDMQIA